MTIAAPPEFSGFLSPGTRLHEYAVERVLGHGGFGITYLATDTNLQKRVAIKEYLPTDLAFRAQDTTVRMRSDAEREAFQWGLEQFVKEARTLARFAHPAVIQIHRYFESNGTAYFVMEYAEGETLGALLRRQGVLPADALQKALLPILDGLQEVHRAGVLHRDIKPENIILRRDGSPVLIDFGAARLTLGSKTRSVLTMATAGYAPLEQYSTTGAQGPWTDIYALGAVAYRALSGRKPVESINRLREDPLVPAALAGQGRYPPAFLAAVDWALAVNHEDRPQNLAEWRLCLTGAIAPPARADAPAAPQLPAAPYVAPAAAPPQPASAAVEATEVLPPAAPAPALEATEYLPTGRGATAAARAAPLLRPALALLVLAGVAGIAALWRDRPPAPQVPVAAPEVPAAVPAQTAAAPQQAAPQPAAPEPAVPEPATPSPAVEPAAAEPAAAAETPAAQVATPAKAAAPVARTVKKRAAPAPAPAPAPAAPRPTPVAAMATSSSFQDCPACPPMVVLPAGAFEMGAAAGANWEKPPHRVALARPLAFARAETTVDQWRACVTAGACAPSALASAKDGALPAVNLSWDEARTYAAWLASLTGRAYRLPSEAEWEYAARAGTTTARYWGEDRRNQCLHANAADRSARSALDAKAALADCDDGHAGLAPVAGRKPNPFGLHDMAGNAWEWTLDCWSDGYATAPADGRPVEAPACRRRVMRGGSWRSKPELLRSSNRGWSPPNLRSDELGLRVIAE